MGKIVLTQLTQDGMRPSDMKRMTSMSFKEDEATEVFGHSKVYFLGRTFPVPKKGVFKCNVGKDCDVQCPFNVAFVYCSQFDRCYKILDTKKSPLCLAHNHSMTGIAVLDGRVQVKSERDQSEEEIDVLKTLALTTLGVAGVKDTLSER